MSSEAACDRDDVHGVDQGSSARVLSLSSAERARIEASAVRAYPLEACGVLVGAIEPGLVRVECVARARNRCTARGAYDLDPGDLVRAEREARSSGLDVVGIWHSHADETAVPSDRDLRCAWSGWSYAIVEVFGGRPGALRAWRLARGRFVEDDVRAEEREMGRGG